MFSNALKTLGANYGARSVAALVFVCLVFVSSACSTVQKQIARLGKRESRPWQTKLSEPETIVPATITANYFIIEVKWDKHGPWRFIVDTGSSATLLSPDYVRCYPASKKDGESARSISAITVRSASGGVQKLPSANVRMLRFGDAAFYNVPVLVYDCAELSAHFGTKIDGIIGFPMFRDTVVSLDYPRSRLVITRRSAVKTPASGAVTVKFNNETRVPIIPVTIGSENMSVLLDSGSDGALILNPFGLNFEFLQKPRTGTSVGTIMGDRVQEIGRLAPALHIGSYTVASPVADITDQLSALGGEILKNYCITFDSKQGNVTFQRDDSAALILNSARSPGVAFKKTPAYWRVASVVPGSPAESAGVQVGDIVARINGEPVSAWPLQRYDALARQAGEITYTFINGPRENPMVLPTFELVR